MSAQDGHGDTRRRRTGWLLACVLSILTLVVGYWIGTHIGAKAAPASPERRIEVIAPPGVRVYRQTPVPTEPPSGDSDAGPETPTFVVETASMTVPVTGPAGKVRGLHPVPPELDPQHVFKDFLAGLPTPEQVRELVDRGRETYIAAQVKRRIDAMARILGDDWERLGLSATVSEYLAPWARERWDSHQQLVLALDEAAKGPAELRSDREREVMLAWGKRYADSLLDWTTFVARTVPLELYRPQKDSFRRLENCGEVATVTPTTR